MEISRQRAWQLKMQRTGRCPQCGEVIPTEIRSISRHCIQCLERRQTLARKRKGTTKRYLGKLWKLKQEMQKRDRRTA